MADQRTSKQLYDKMAELGMAAQACNPNTSELEAGRSGLQGYPRPQSDFEARLGYRRLCLKN